MGIDNIDNIKDGFDPQADENLGAEGAVFVAYEGTDASAESGVKQATAPVHPVVEGEDNNEILGI